MRTPRVKPATPQHAQALRGGRLPETGVSGTHLEPGCRDWNTVRTSWHVGTCPPGREKSWRETHRRSVPRTDEQTIVKERRFAGNREGWRLNFTGALKLPEYLWLAGEAAAQHPRALLPPPPQTVRMLHSDADNLSPSSLAALTPGLLHRSTSPGYMCSLLQPSP